MVALTMLALLITGCAGPPDCGESLAKAERAAEQRQPLASWVDAVDAECRARAESRWAATLSEDCDPLYGFHAGYSEIEPAAGCADPAFVEARNLGELLGEIEREQAGIEARLAAGELGEGERGRLRQRLIVIERDRPQIEALARIQGYLPPADVPEAPGD